MPVTIIEGPDCSGKTTLMKRLLQQDDTMTAIHCGPPGASGPWANYAGQLIQIWNEPRHQHFIFDRFLYGELVYGPILRPKVITGFSMAHVRMLERVLLALEGALITAITDRETSKQLWQERVDTELFSDEGVFDRTWGAFDQLFKDPTVSLPKIPYDITETSMGQINIGLSRDRAALNEGPGIGMFKPGVTLLVGEQINPRQAVHTDWPFVAPDGSSLWLAHLLNEAQIPESQLYWINALDSNGQDTDSSFIDSLRPARVVALGKTAEIWCKDSGVARAEGYTYEAVPHPQFWRRFKSNDVEYPLIDALNANNN